MSSKENLKDALKRSNRKLFELRKINISLEEQVDELKLEYKCLEAYCKVYHKDKIKLKVKRFQHIIKRFFK